jgi:type I restriction enzyme S subunit
MSGKYQAYPEYKDSGVEWLGQIPSHWTQCGFKRFALIRNGRDHKEVEAPDGNYPVIGSGGGFSHANQ